jgi:hypothetical protein
LRRASALEIPADAGQEAHLGSDRMTLECVWRKAVAILIFTVGIPVLCHAGGVGFGDDDTDEDSGPSYFGFVREVDGPGVSDAKVTAALKDRGALVTRTDIMGVYKIPGFGKDIDPKDITISCSKEGYKQVNVERRPGGDPKDPVEIECYLQKQ